MKTLRNLCVIVAALAASVSAEKAFSANLTAAQTDSALTARGYEKVVPVYPGTLRFITGAYGGINFLNLGYGAPNFDPTPATGANEGCYWPDVDSVAVPGELDIVRAYAVPDTTDDANIADRWIHAQAVPPIVIPSGVDYTQNPARTQPRLRLMSANPAYGSATVNLRGILKDYDVTGRLKGIYNGNTAKLNGTGIHFIKYTPLDSVDKKSLHEQVIKVLNLQ